MARSTLFFPLLAVLAAYLGYAFNAEIVPFKNILVPIIAIIMATMGLTLTFNDFKVALKTPQPVLLGLTLQFSLMPFLAFIISHTFTLPLELMVGMILVGTAPGGTASNVMTFIARGNVALSVTMTTFSTLLSIVLTPLLTHLYLNETVDVDKWGMLMSMLKIILLPLLAGIMINMTLPSVINKIKPTLPLIAVLGICIAIAIVVALNAAKLAFISSIIVLAVIIHNIAGFTAGYSIARLCHFNLTDARTIAIEVGMQNSGLATVIALKHFMPLSAIPPALFSIIQNLCGLLLATYWCKSTKKITPPADRTISQV